MKNPAIFTTTMNDILQNDATRQSKREIQSSKVLTIKRK